MTAKPTVVAAPSVIREKIPASLLRPCPGKSRKQLVTTGDIVDRLTQTESALATCSAQVDGVRRWNTGQ